MLNKDILYFIFCLIAGGAIAAGYVSFIALLGVFEKLLEKQKNAKFVRLYENLIIVGVTLGNLVYLFKIKINLGLLALVSFTLFGGIFTGCLAGALAEILNIFPIISRRYNIRKFLPYILIAAAIGKAIGSSLQLIYINQI